MPIKGYEEAFADLGFSLEFNADADLRFVDRDPPHTNRLQHDSTTSNTVLLPWQINGIATKLRHEIIWRGELDALDCGMGKTTKVFAAIYFRAKYIDEQLQQGKEVDTRPTLVLTPGPVQYESLKELRSWFQGLLCFHVFYGADRTTMSTETRATLLPSDAAEAHQLITHMDHQDVVLLVYENFQSRTLVVIPTEPDHKAVADPKYKLASPAPSTEDARSLEEDVVKCRTRSILALAMMNDDDEDLVHSATAFSVYLKENEAPPPNVSMQSLDDRNFSKTHGKITTRYQEWLLEAVYAIGINTPSVPLLYRSTWQTPEPEYQQRMIPGMENDHDFFSIQLFFIADIWMHMVPGYHIQLGILRIVDNTEIPYVLHNEYASTRSLDSSLPWPLESLEPLTVEENPADIYDREHLDVDEQRLEVTKERKRAAASSV
ncbi:uncharacterized protein Z519_03725 [Cladophialophora bantiana CBS 173.52]|uniref:SNF2 N-terminal domain-containing protein n=1 Tax=Cladophialophora bantiana (strain ATCC 10958 / CBS 173.52 / CDC B-1940 / NIH 8579) TaxID=1442370 RepID=A0A0D2EYU3_CLAB1|nr:uncharacterized protein Z519_03725 [Cladophialophora bantiana CBS 173.52]KIW95141.1 hypothetical protein Z519_03725 [Cladophialophora bantiana CBS 173.52]